MRKVVKVVVEADNRDKGKTFQLTEMDAWRAEEWGIRALTVMMRANMELPAGMLGGGFVAVLEYGIRGLFAASFEEAKPLLDEMLTCVKFLPSPEKEPNIQRGIYEGDIEEVSTLVWLREKVVELHSGFSVAAALYNLKAHAAAVLALLNQPITPTSPPA